MVNGSGIIQYTSIWGKNGRDISSMILLDKINNIYNGGYTSSFGVGGTDIFILKYKGLGSLEEMGDNNSKNGGNTGNNSNTKDSEYFTLSLYLFISSSIVISILFIVRLLYGNNKIKCLKKVS